MFRPALAILIGTIAVAGQSAKPAQGVMAGVENPARARQHWILQCQGCHRPDATGTPETTPAMAGHVSRFTHIPAGREYLGRVPGVATAALSDSDLAELLNWTLLKFDPGHLPAEFKPYTTEEIAKLRRKPFRTEAYMVRQHLIAEIEGKDPK